MSIDVNVQNDLVIVTESSEDIVVNVSNAAGPAGPAGVGVPVGGSTGQVLKKLSATNYDTYWALDGGGVPYSGATGDVDLGEYELKAGQVEFDQTPTGAIGAAVMRWNDSDGTVDLGLKGGNVTLQVGQEQVLRVVNKTGADLLESQYRAVRIRLVSEGGSQGQRLAVVLAQGDNDPDSTTTIGIVTENIDNNQEGFITTSGEVRGINTTGSLQSETWVDGDIIYLSPTIPGGITKVKPTAPQHLLQLGYVIYAHAVNGKIFVKIDNGYELSELHDVFAPSPTDGQGIFWNTANLRYQNNTVAGILGYTPVPTTRTLTINGTAYDLSADRSWTVGATPAGSNTQLQYNNSGVFGASANLVWDNTNSRLGIGTASPQNNLDVVRGTAGTMARDLYESASFSYNGESKIGFYTSSSNSAHGSAIVFGQTNLQASGAFPGFEMQYVYNSTIASNNWRLNYIGRGETGLVVNYAANLLNVYADGTVILNPVTLGISATPKLIIGTSSVSTFMLDVNGTARVSGATTITGNLTLSNSNPLSLTNASAYFSIGSYFFGSSGSIIGANASSSDWAVRVSSGGLLIANGTNNNHLLKEGLALFTDNAANTNITGSASAVLQANSTTKGFLPPRMTNAQRVAIASPAVGLIVYCTDATEGLYQYINNAWVNLTGIVTNRQTASYTLALGDSNDLVEMNVATANNLTVPLNSSVAFPIGTKIDIAQYGAGQTTVVATGGVTIRSAGGALKLAAQYSGASLVKIGTDEWYLFGDITV